MPGRVPPIQVEVDDLPEGWQAWCEGETDDYYCFPEVYYFCPSLQQTQWDRPSLEDAQVWTGKNDDVIPNPPQPKQGVIAQKAIMSCEDPEDVFQPDEDMLEACLETDIEKLRRALSDGADVSLPNFPWQDTPLHLATKPFQWASGTVAEEMKKRFEITQYLVRQGADLDVENGNHLRPIDVALLNGYQDVVDFLEAQGASYGWFGAAASGEVEKMKELFNDTSLDLDQKGRYSRTACAEAHLRYQWKVEMFLTQQGCSKELPMEDLRTARPAGADIGRCNLVPAREIQHSCA